MTEATNKPMSKILSRRAALTAGSATALAGIAGLLGAPAANAQSPSVYPKLKIGMDHKAVAMLADLLVFLRLPSGQKTRNSKHFSHAMKVSVLKHQNRNYLTPDGVVGPKTWASMLASAANLHWGVATVRRGSRTQSVVFLQRALVARQRRSLATDSVFGGATESRVREYQRSCGLVADGVVGFRTWAALRYGD
ncbi:peptidoglycan-binding protein [Paeniglutamicibacter gangotriensis]|uniref:peptidoglycan-binding domain-containing protein n=1 Tax=Paeniglutamicibacter gangotriensis TaxID=254787 RepID=UPI0037C9A0C9